MSLLSNERYSKLITYKAVGEGTKNNRQLDTKLVWITTYILTPRGWILFEKLRVAQHLKQPAFFTEPELSLT
jgi:hypothetical protein